MLIYYILLSWPTAILGGHTGSITLLLLKKQPTCGHMGLGLTGLWWILFYYTKPLLQSKHISVTIAKKRHTAPLLAFYPARSVWQGGKLASRLVGNTSKGSGDSPRHKTCFKGEEVRENFNHRECKPKACKYKHVCKFCQSTEHPISMCKKFKRSQPE